MVDSRGASRLLRRVSRPLRRAIGQIACGPGASSRVHRHPAGAYVYVIDGSVMFGLGGREPVVVKAGDSFYEPPGALISASGNASQDLPASFIVFFVLGEGEEPMVYDRE